METKLIRKHFQSDQVNVREKIAVRFICWPVRRFAVWER